MSIIIAGMSFQEMKNRLEQLAPMNPPQGEMTESLEELAERLCERQRAVAEAILMIISENNQKINDQLSAHLDI